MINNKQFPRALKKSIPEGKWYCSKCHGIKHTHDLIPVSNSHFYCRQCNTERVQKYRKTPEGKKRTYAAVYKSMKKHNKRHNARVRIYNAVKKGEIIRPKVCSECGKRKKIFAHHEDYSKPLEVIWYCMDCHCKKHRGLL